MPLILEEMAFYKAFLRYAISLYFTHRTAYNRHS